MTDSDRVGDRRRRTAFPPPRWGSGEDGQTRSWFAEDGGADASAEIGTDLVNLGYLRAALRRSRRLWAGLAVVGLLLGVAFWMTRPPTPQAATTLFLNVGPEGQPGAAILNDQAMAGSRGVARIALGQLKLHETIDSLLGTYNAAALTDRLLRITVSAPSDDEAVRRANAIASAFLTFRSGQLQTQQRLQFAGLDHALAQSEGQLNALNARISKVAQQPSSKSQRAELTKLQGSRDQANSELRVLKDGVETTKAAAQETVAAMVGQSKVLDPASPLAESRFKPLILFSGAGLIVGLFVGAGIVIVRALVSDRLRRRDDVALALGAPVRLSIPGKPPSRWSPRRRGLAAAHGRDLQRTVAFLRGILQTETQRNALAVVPVDDPRTAALSVISLAVSLAQQGARVLVADLGAGAPAATLVGRRNPGVHDVQVDGVDFRIAIPDADEIAPVGPLSPVAAEAEPTLASQVAEAYASADAFLTLSTLDPSVASDNLQTWASDAVVVVTAGRSSWTKVHAVGEMIRIAGSHLVCAVLVGADKWDESLGVAAAPAAPQLPAFDTSEEKAADSTAADAAGGRHRRLSLSPPRRESGASS